MSTLDESTPPAWCRGEDIPVSPFEALRVAYGMLLGEDDFRVLQGNPRGKQMLHSAWLHGSAVVWGFGVGPEQGGRRIQVEPGLAIDGVGRELYLGAPRCMDVDAWLAARKPDQAGCDAGKGQSAGPPASIVVHLVAVLHSCPTRPVPSLADPCDVQRMHTDCSRVVETVRLELREQADPADQVHRSYHGVRVLLGLDRFGGEADRVGREAQRELQAIARVPAEDRSNALVEAFRRIAALDVTELRPAAEDRETIGIFPTTEGASEVLLAEVRITWSDGKANWEPDIRVRRSLLPTSTIQELTCAPAPGLLLTAPGVELGGPRVIRSTIGWTDSRTLSFEITKPLNSGSMSKEQVSVTSLGPDDGWLTEDIRGNGVDYELIGGRHTVRVRLHQPPVHEIVRLVVRGTGPTPATGVDGVPLADHDGHDAVHHTTKHATKDGAS
jgi:hypothetical protein